VIGGYGFGEGTLWGRVSVIEVKLGPLQIESKVINEDFRRAAHSVAIAFQDSNAIIFGGVCDALSGAADIDMKMVQLKQSLSTDCQLRMKDGKLMWSDPYRLVKKVQYVLVLENLESQEKIRVTVDETFFDIQQLKNGNYCGYIKTTEAIKGPEFKFIVYGKVLVFKKKIKIHLQGI
jgi:hypothetical protein